MMIHTEHYLESLKRWPTAGQHILAHQTKEDLVVYQAYRPAIANYALKAQQLGGNDFSFNRMSWIKTNFLWMMYRCGWAEKENQERVLALWVSKKWFDKVLNEAAFSTYKPGYHASYEDWKTDMDMKEVRLQWDPDHDPFGNKQNRRAIQLGLKGKILTDFGKSRVTKIEDVTDFVKEQKMKLDTEGIASLMIPFEMAYKPADLQLASKIGLDT